MNQAQFQEMFQQLHNQARQQKQHKRSNEQIVKDYNDFKEKLKTEGKLEELEKNLKDYDEWLNNPCKETMEKMIDKGLALKTMQEIVGFIEVMTNLRHSNVDLFMKHLNELSEIKRAQLVKHILPTFQHQTQQGFTAHNM